MKTRLKKKASFTAQFKGGQHMGRFLTNAFLVLLLTLTGAVSAAFADLERVGPVTSASGGYPAWYQDKTGLALEFCTPVNQAELNDGWCVILPADVPTGAVPEVFPTNYSEEHFYWLATAGDRTNGLLVLALEAAFASGPAIPGDQIVFGRLRISIPSLPVSGDYKVYTPFGDFNFPGLTAGTKLFFTTDIGITCGTQFDCALNSPIGPFLLPSPFPGGPEVRPIPDLVKGSGVDPWYDALPAATPYPGTGKKYIADPARIGPVTGSPLPPFVGNDGITYDHNTLRIEGPGYVFHENNFVVGGRVMAASIPGRVTVNRASYGQTATATKLDVFATAIPTTQGRLPAAPLQPTTNPDLGFYPAPCATDPVTGAVTGPPTGTGLLYYQMFKNGKNWWGQNQPAAIPPQVCVQDLNARDAAGNVVPAYFMGDVTDEVDVTIANWDPTAAGGTLTVAATSSDKVTAPTLTVAGFGAINPVTGQFLVSNIAAPPAKLSVVSSRGGVDTLEVRTGVGIPVSTTTPVTNADSVTIPEDTPAPNLNVLANDTLNGVAIDPASATVAITAQGRLGTATLNADKTITYTPNLNVNGTDIVGYTVTVNTITSNEGYLTVIITPVNDIPVAVNDTGGAPNNKPVTINVLANDTDPDGQTDLANAVIVTVPATGATITCNNGVAATVGTVCTGGLITFTPTVQGTFTFTYRAQDKALAQSANTATVTVTVNATEAIVVTKSQYVVSKNRWVVSGTDSVIAGQTLAIAYAAGANGGTYKVNGVCSGSAAGTMIGSATVDPLGNWIFDVIMTSAGVLNPSNTGGNSTGFWCTPPKQLTITSPLGGTATANITLK